MESLFTQHFASPIGNILIKATTAGVTVVSFMETTELQNSNAATENTALQLQEYFDGTRKIFTITLAPEGTAFQQKVWQELQSIPFGRTTNYQQQAIQLGDVKAIRAMASANGKNPVAIIIPCHRVIGSNGSLTGYAGELWRKQWLLDHEAKVNGSYNKLF